MKPFLYCLTVSLALCVFLFSSCKKQVDQPHIAEKETASFAAGTSCKPVVIGRGGGGTWSTEMQKWYGSDGRVAYLKANLLGAIEPMLPWGEVTYHNNNQVYIRNVLFNDTLLRVTLDAQQRPVASYFLYTRTQVPYRDTSYYYFTGNRLDSIISLFGPYFSVSGITFRKIYFTYDMYGNVVRIEEGTTYGLGSVWNLTYDYTKPVAGMFPAYMIDRPYQLLQYLDLLHFPVHHQLVSAPMTLFGLTWLDNYSNYQLLENGLVQSYSNTDVFGTTRTYYTGWDCGSAPAAPVDRKKDTITSFEDFMKRYR